MNQERRSTQMTNDELLAVVKSAPQEDDLVRRCASWVRSKGLEVPQSWENFTFSVGDDLDVFFGIERFALRETHLATFYLHAPVTGGRASLRVLLYALRTVGGAEAQRQAFRDEVNDGQPLVFVYKAVGVASRGGTYVYHEVDNRGDATAYLSERFDPEAGRALLEHVPESTASDVRLSLQTLLSEGHVDVTAALRDGRHAFIYEMEGAVVEAEGSVYEEAVARNDELLALLRANDLPEGSYWSLAWRRYEEERVFTDTEEEVC
jgi:hypothetical protein